MIPLSSRPRSSTSSSSLRDRRAHRLAAAPGTDRVPGTRHVLVVGGGIAGLAAATGLLERGVQVTLVEPEDTLGGRVRSWPLGQGRTMGRGFHAFFRQYYNLRQLLERLPADAPGLVPVPDYPLVSREGLQDSFARIPRTPPWNIIGFVLSSPSFRLRDLRKVDADAALGLLDVDFPQTFRDHDGRSAAELLDGLGFPQRARHLALEVFARSFFADPREFSAGELVGMFHTYFLGSAEGLLFDTAAEDFETALWGPLGQVLEEKGLRRIQGSVEHLDFTGSAVRARWSTAEDHRVQEADAVVLAAGPESTRRLARQATGIEDGAWHVRLDRLRTAPPFAVLRLWLDRPVHPERPAFLGTSGFGALDNISVLERFEGGAMRWSQETGGGVVELHAYALDASSLDREGLRQQLLDQLGRVWPETAEAQILHEEFLVEQDCPLVDTSPWQQRPGVQTPDPRLLLAGDSVRCDLPVALMERAATTGWQSANALLEGWGTAGQDLLSPPLRGPAWARAARRLLRRTQSTRRSTRPRTSADQEGTL